MMKIGIKLTKLDPPNMSLAPSPPFARISFWGLLRLWPRAFLDGTLHRCWGALYFYLLPHKIFFREFLFHFRNPFLLVAGAVGAAVAGGAGTSTGPSLVDWCLMFEKIKMRLVVGIFGWFLLADLDKNCLILCAQSMCRGLFTR